MNVFRPAHRERLVQRIRGLSPSSERQWGTMELPQAIAHMSRQIELAMGEIQSGSAPSPFRLPILKQMVVYLMPWPRNIKTAPVLLEADASELDEERARLLEVIERAVARGRDAEWADHPLFGTLSHRAWGTMIARHLDHHLRQFSA